MDEKNNIKLKEDLTTHYRENLKNLIVSHTKESNYIENLIYALSFYIVNSDNAYFYNLPFLPHQYEEFTKFLKNANQKYNLLVETANIIKESDNIKTYLETNEHERTNISISINDFLTINLNDDFDFCDKLSIGGTSRKPHEDVFTIKYQTEKTMQVRAKKVIFSNEKNNSTKELSKTLAYGPFIKMLEEILKIEANIDKEGDVDG